MIKLYGIPNCDTMKQARCWLDENNLAYEFHDYKKQGVPEAVLKQWVKQLGWETLLNRKGTTWRKLDESIRESINEFSAIRLMLTQPSIIKRPVLVSGKTLLAGFDATAYLEHLR
jgi:Spx/MgsR family transcriptional regulator